jgi:hypothetical protein
MWGDGRVLPISPLALAPRPAGRLVARSPPQVVCVPACDFLTLRESLRSPDGKQVVSDTGLDPLATPVQTRQNMFETHVGSLEETETRQGEFLGHARGVHAGLQ